MEEEALLAINNDKFEIAQCPSWICTTVMCRKSVQAFQVPAVSIMKTTTTALKMAGIIPAPANSQYNLMVMDYLLCTEGETELVQGKIVRLAGIGFTLDEMM